ncbi:MAG TPA: amino acid adenylation domain-containing protein, partial [Thermoanaerobaculia bacterium]|nr:amino acid adenylation domain-containing protein [Thermoanaerobaculia bacterium]
GTAASPAKPWQLLTLSARTSSALAAATANLAAHLSSHLELDLADVAYTCKVGRRPFEHRRVVLGRDLREAAQALAGEGAGHVLTGAPGRESLPVAFLFPGLADHYPDMGLGLYRSEPLFRSTFDQCCEILARRQGLDLRRALFPGLRSPAGRGEEGGRPTGGLDLRRMLGRGGAVELPGELERTAVSHPALFALELSLAHLWQSWGVRPQALLGYSLGEYVAACIAGVFSLEEGLVLVAERARLIDRLPVGAMLAVPMSAPEVEPYLGPGLSLAAENGPSLSVVAGTPAAVGDLERRLAGEGVLHRRLAVSRAFHSAAMAEVADELLALVRSIDLRPPQVPYISNVTGTWIDPAQATDPAYWVQHLCQTVRFGAGARALTGERKWILLEVGPGQTLGSLARQCAQGGGELLALPSLRHGYEGEEDEVVLLRTLGQLWLNGVEVDWAGFYAGERRRRVPLPPYPFERQRLLLEPREPAGSPAAELYPARGLADLGGSRSLECPAPERAARERGPDLRPDDEVERTLAALWRELLGVEQVSADDDFFQLGGHSLLGLQVIAGIQRSLGVELSIGDLFAARTFARLAETIAVLSASLPHGQPGIGRARPLAAGRARLFPLSLTQERLWFLDQLQRGSPAYNIPYAVHLRGALALGAIAASLGKVVGRHEALRTRFVLHSGHEVQSVEPAVEAPLRLVDLEALPGPRRSGEASRVMTAEAGRPFDLAVAPLLRATALRLAPEDHLLLINVHHIVADGWSLGVLGRELSLLYAALVEGRAPGLGELPVQYADYAAWQREWLSSTRREEQLVYWRERLAAPVALDLPGDRPRPAAQSFRGGELPVVVTGEIAARLVSLARAERATLFMALLASFAALLSRYSGQDDLVVGTVVANRGRPEIDGLIGFFVNTLPLRLDLDGDPPFPLLLGRARETALGAYAHQQLPFAAVVEALQPERDLSRSPLFDVMLVLQDGAEEALRLPGVDAALVPLHNGTAKFDLTLSLAPVTEGLAGGLEFSSDLFDGTTVQRLAEHLLNLLRGWAAVPQRRLSEVDLLGAAERRQVLAEWNAAAAASGFPEGSLHGLFEVQAARTPEAVAVLHGGLALTYRELDRKAARLSRRLRRLGVGPEVPVGVYSERRAEMVVALLAVLKAGGAYLPLDPAYPAPRLAFLLADSAAPVLLAQSPLLPSLPPYPGTVVALDGQEVEEPRGDAGASPSIHPEQLAYLIYTSGSTGTPKGVAIRHRGAVALVSWALATYPASWLAGVLAGTSICFDLSVFELFVPLAAGGTVILVDDVLALPGLPAGNGVTLVNTVPSAMAELARGGGVPASVRAVNLAGEALRRELVTQVYRLPGILEVHNLYGPSEDTTYSSGGRVPRRPAGEPTIGRPLAGRSAYVLDRQARPLPAGVPGELYLSGPGLARGYFDRPALTAEKFVPDPAGGAAGGRLYRTGDLARWRATGELEFLGRSDQQVKVRGFRIELGEVEAALAAHPAVRQAVVVARPEPSGGHHLVAYVVPAGEAETRPDAAALRDFLAQRLPAPFLPARFVALDHLPLTPSGKVDRRALPAPEPGRGEEGRSAPRTPVEELIAGIWEEVLGQAAVSVDASFFDLGGHSLLATQVASRVRQSLEVDLPVRTLFAAPTVAALAAWVEAARSAGRQPLPPIPRADRCRPLPLSPGQRRLWFLDQLEPGSAAYHVPVLGRLEGPLDERAFWRSLAGLVARHEVLRTRFEPASGEPVQVITAPGSWPPCRVELSGLPAGSREQELARLERQEGARPFDLARGPLCRAMLVGLARERHALVLVLHHIVCDGWSMGVVLGELTALYRTFVTGEPSPLPELAVQFADFTVWQLSWLAGDRRVAELAYWRQELAGAPALLGLPTDRPRPAVQSLRGRQVAVKLPSARLAGLQAVGRRSGVTLFMVLLAAFQVLLSRLGGESDIPVGTPVANRTRPEIERLIGFFVNTLVLRGLLQAEEPFADFLRRVRATALAAYAHQDLPFETLVAELAPERSLGHSPLFQVMLVLQNAPLAAFDLGELRLSAVPPAGGSAKFDLCLSLEAVGEGLAGTLEYAADLFDATTAQRLAGHLETLLAAISAPSEDGEAGARVGELPLLAAGERRQLIVEWNDRSLAATAVESPVHLGFERQAGRTPSAIAVRSGGAALSYGELNARANRLARQLRAAGVVPEVRVGIAAERSPRMLVAILGTLKAGGAYVPLDPTYPPERLAYMLEDAEAGALLIDLPPSALPGWAEGVPVLGIEAASAGEGDPGNPESGATGESLVYVLYTSGSMGRPKGVAMPHRVLANLLAWQRTVLPAAGVRTLQFAPLGFDVSFQEIFSTLGEGGELVIADDFARRDPGLLLHLLADERIERLFVPPVALLQLAEVAAAGPPLALCDVITAGEQLRVTAALRRWFRLLRGATLHNHYGPTEGHVVSALRLAEPADEWPELPPIGRPIDGLRLYLLDRRLQAVPAGVAGELYLGGTVPVRGYLRRPDFTAERFVPDAVSGVPGARLYRTGDLARSRSDGVVQFLGRSDDQVKVRGFRIEPGEIESALATYPGVAEAAVLAREDLRPGERRLVAYLVAEPVPDARELRSFLAARLPEHMVPVAFVPLPAFPLTANGKLDRRALPAPAEPERSTAGSFERLGVSEEIVAAIWCDLLGISRVGRRDSFFELGGHSLLATQLVSRLRKCFSVELPLRRVFEVPTLGEMAAHLESLRRAEAGGEERFRVPALRRVSRREPLVVSFAQARLWFLDQLEPGSPVYNIPAAVELRGRLERSALAAAFGEVVRRHEALRTTFAEVGGEPVQVIAESVVCSLPLVDLQGLPGVPREEEAERLKTAEARRPFDLRGFDGGSLLRVALLGLEAERHVLLLTMHHIVSDGWSLGVLVREFGALYEAFVEGRPSPLAALTIQYADFASWQREYLSGEYLESELAWWREELAGMPSLLELPTDRPRPAVQSHRGASRHVRLPLGLTRQAQALGRREGATLFMVLLAGFQALLARYSGQQDLAVGSPIAGRTHREIEDLIGFFVNTLVLRGDLTGALPGGRAGELSFRELLGRAREGSLGAHTHQDVPFERLVQELAPERNLAHAPLFQAMLALQNTPFGDPEIRSLRLRAVGVAGTTARFDLALALTEEDGGLGGVIEYATDLFDASTIARLLLGYERLLAAAVAAPERRVRELPLLGEAERQQVLVEWNDTAAPGAPGVIELFAAQARRTPEAVAVRPAGDEGAGITYRELDRRASRLAWRLRALGIRPEVPVGLCVEPSQELAVGVLGILRSGGALLPLDPSHPPARLAFQLQDAAVPVLVTQAHLLPGLPPHGAATVLLEEEAVGEEAGEPERSPAPGDLAYLIYTSGTTGRPKAVQVEHGMLASTLAATRERFRFAADDRMPCLAASTFDISLFELLSPLLTGGTAVLFPLRPVLDVERLVDHLGELTCLHAVPALMREIVDSLRRRRDGGPVPDVARMRAVFTGGDTVPSELLENLRGTFPAARVWVLYGPTEGTIVCTAHPVPPPPVPARALLGRPLAGAVLHVRDEHGELLPPGVPGELWIGGAGVTRGYLGRDDLTAEKYVRRGGARFYHSGDRVRRLADGTLEFLGRLDHQVKVRGFRIELGEIEATLVAIEGVREAVVMVREDRPETGLGDRRLVAYVAGDRAADSCLVPETLRQALRERLPSYMVPAAVVTLAALPLTPNGKVDRQALPAPEWQSAEKTWLAPRTPVEEVLAGIWTELLGVERVGAADHFFELGGHSLLATQVMSRLRAAFHVEIPLRGLFETPVLADLAARVEAARRAGGGGTALPLVRIQRDGDIPLSFAQQRLWFIDQLEPGSPLYNIAMAFRVEGPLDALVLALCLGEIVRRHEPLRTVFAAPGGSPVQVIRPAAGFQLPVIDVSGLPGSRHETLALTLAGEEAGRPFDLGSGPLLRGLLLRLAVSEERADHVLALTLHHIAGDGWSVGILVREVTALYTAFAEGRPSPLPEPAVQYADFAAWQRSWLHGEVLENEISYWRRQLAGLPPLLDLPTDRPRPAVQSFRGASWPVYLPAALARQAEALSRREGATLFMVLLAGFQALLARWSGQEDLAVGSPVAGRTHREIEDLIGFFVNTLVLRGDLTGEPSFQTLLDRVRDTALAAHAHQDVPFEKLVQELAPERNLAHPPLFQVMFGLQNLPAGSLEIRSLSLRPINVAGTTAKHDLTLMLTEQDGALNGTIEYATDLFDAATIDRWILHYERLLTAALAAPEGKACELSLLSPGERQ